MTGSVSVVGQVSSERSRRVSGSSPGWVGQGAAQGGAVSGVDVHWDTSSPRLRGRRDAGDREQAHETGRTALL